MLRLIFFFACFFTTVFQTSALQAAEKTKQNEIFHPFTGKVAATKVRVRLKPDLDGQILRQAHKGDLFLIVGEEGDFFAIEPPKETKTYVFRSYILDNVVEANRVNVRLEPHIDAPIVGQLQAGERIAGQVSPLNHKWLEIAAPKSARFYISKEYITQVGGPEYIGVMERRKTEVQNLLNEAFSLAENACKKSYEEMTPDEAISKFQLILKNYHDFPHFITQAKEGLALLKETFLKKKIEFLEQKAELTPHAKEELIAKHKAENKDLFSEVIVDPELFDKRNFRNEATSSMRIWSALEESLYLSWVAFHPNKNLDDFYTEQKANATVITGTLEEYPHPVKEKPGEYLLRKGEVPIAFVYSTHVDLKKYEGKTVTFLASPRPNNHFAFPAYFVLNIER